MKNQTSDAVQVHTNRDEDPYDEFISGEIRQGEEGYWRFYPNPGAVLTAGEMKRISLDIAGLNIKERNSNEDSNVQDERNE